MPLNDVLPYTEKRRTVIIEVSYGSKTSYYRASRQKDAIIRDADDQTLCTQTGR
jgi:hypothetical protein